jgi:hypothetical protein
MSKAQRYKQQQKDQKAAAAAKAAKGPSIAEPYKEKTLRERQAENKAQLAKHQQSMERLKQFEEKIHAKPPAAAGAKDEGGVAKAADSGVKHEADTAIKPAV